LVIAKFVQRRDSVLCDTRLRYGRALDFLSSHTLAKKYLCGVVTRDAEFVALWIAEVSAVVVWVIVRAQTRRAFADAPMYERRRVAGIDGGTCWRKQRRHLPVTRCGGFSVERKSDDEQWPRCWTFPSCLVALKAFRGAAILFRRSIDKAGRMPAQ
jgi:hypothetical protein